MAPPPSPEAAAETVPTIEAEAADPEAAPRVVDELPVIRGAADEGVVELVVARGSVPLHEPWLEIVALDQVELKPLLLRSVPDEAEEALVLPAPHGRGRTLICRGANPPHGSACAEVFLRGGDQVAVDFPLGQAVSGTVALGLLPAAGCKVAVVPNDLRSVRPWLMSLGLGEKGQLRRVAADNEGRFLLPPLAAGRYGLEILLPSGRIWRSEAFDLPPPVLGEDDAPLPIFALGEMVVDPGAGVEFVATDSEGLPVAEVRVGGRQGVDLVELVTFEGSTDRDGRANLSGFRLDRAARLYCEKVGYLPVTLDLELVPSLVRCDMQRPAVLWGRVESLDGRPIGALRATLHRLDPETDGEPPTSARRAQVEVDPAPVADSESEGAEAEIEGSVASGGPGADYRFGDLSPGAYLLSFQAPGFEPYEEEVELAAEQGLEMPTLYLDAGMRRAGRVIDAETGEGIAGAELRALEPQGAAWAVSDEEGLFSLEVPRSIALRLAVRAEGYAEQRLNLEARASSRRAVLPDLEIQLERGGYLLAIVENRWGRPCAGCRVRMEPGGWLRTDEHGEALSHALVPGFYRVLRPRVAHLGSTVVEEPDAEVRRVRVRRDAVVTVRFSTGGGNLRLQPLSPLPPAARLLLISGIQRQESGRESDGTYRFQRPRAGRKAAIWLRYVDNETGDEKEVRLGPLGSVATDEPVPVAVPTTMVSGQLRSFDGRDLPAVEMRLRSVAEGWLAARVQAAADGSFSIPHVQPGFYVLSAGDRPLTIVRLDPGRALRVGTYQVFPGGF